MYTAKVLIILDIKKFFLLKNIKHFYEYSCFIIWLQCLITLW